MKHVRAEWITQLFKRTKFFRCRFQWPRGLRRKSAAARLMRLWVRNPSGCMDVCPKCCVLSGRGLCDGKMTLRGESYRMRCVWVWSARLGPLKLSSCEAFLSISSVLYLFRLKIILLHAMKEYRGSRGIPPLSLNLSARWKWAVNFTPRPLYSWGRRPVPTV